MILEMLGYKFDSSDKYLDPMVAIYMDIPSLGPELKSKEKTQNFQSTLQLCSCEEVDFSFLCAQTNPLTRLMRLPSKVILHGRCNVSAT